MTKAPTAPSRSRSIDFDLVAEFYDSYVNTSFDIPFWLDVARQCPGPRLELMCGTGRIARAILAAGMEIDGLDYSKGLLARFRKNMPVPHPACRLHLADARDFSLKKRYGLIFTGFHAIAEVLEDSGKLEVFSRVREHLLPQGRFWLSAHNPAIRARSLDGRTVDIGHFPIPDTDEEVSVSGCYLYDPQTGITTGKQTYVCTCGNEKTRTVELPVKFHLAKPQQLDDLAKRAGLHILSRYGSYERAPFEESSSPFYILEAAPSSAAPGA